MARSIPIGQYVPGNSVIHRLDPRTKILVTFVYVVTLFLAKSLAGYVVMAAFVLMFILVSGINPARLLMNVRAIVFILALTVVLNAFMTEGKTVYRLGFLEVTEEGIRFGLLMAGRLLLLVLSTSLLTLTTSPIQLTDGMERILRPFGKLGLPAAELAMMTSIALRFIPTLFEEAERVMKAQMARGTDFESRNPFTRIRSMIPILVPLFVSSFRRADELGEAMEARCFKGGLGRTRMKELNFGAGDALVLSVVFVLMAGIIWFDRLGGLRGCGISSW